MNPTVADKIRGVVYGQAIGDALGLGTEFLTKSQVAEYYRHGLTRYGQIIRDDHTRRWRIGSWTDDTDQMLCILDSLLEKKRVDVLDIAARFHRWAVQGGVGIGKTVFSVLFAPDFCSDPQAVAKRVWEASNRYSAANGGVTPIRMGLWPGLCSVPALDFRNCLRNWPMAWRANKLWTTELSD